MADIDYNWWEDDAVDAATTAASKPATTAATHGKKRQFDDSWKLRTEYVRQFIAEHNRLPSASRFGDHDEYCLARWLLGQSRRKGEYPSAYKADIPRRIAWEKLLPLLAKHGWRMPAPEVAAPPPPTSQPPPPPPSQPPPPKASDPGARKEWPDIFADIRNYVETHQRIPRPGKPARQPEQRMYQRLMTQRQYHAITSVITADRLTAWNDLENYLVLYGWVPRIPAEDIAEAIAEAPANAAAVAAYTPQLRRGNTAGFSIQDWYSRFDAMKSHLTLHKFWPRNSGSPQESSLYQWQYRTRVYLDTPEAHWSDNAERTAAAREMIRVMDQYPQFTACYRFTSAAGSLHSHRGACTPNKQVVAKQPPVVDAADWKLQDGYFSSDFDDSDCNSITSVNSEFRPPSSHKKHRIA